MLISACREGVVGSTGSGTAAGWEWRCKIFSRAITVVSPRGLAISTAQPLAMPTDTEIRLLTLLNVSAVKRPRGGDLPGGHRGSPSRLLSPLASTSTLAENGAANGHTSPEHEPAEVPLPKKRKSVSWGGKLGPSGSAHKKNKGKGKVTPIGQHANGVVAQKPEGTAQRHLTSNGNAAGSFAPPAGDESDDNEAGPSSKLSPSRSSPNIFVDIVQAGLTPSISTLPRTTRC